MTLSAETTVTLHAVERFISRHRRSLTIAEGRAELRAALPLARPLKEKTWHGDEQWVLAELGVVAVIKRDGHGLPPVCVTVLPARDVREIAEEDLEEFHAAAARAAAGSEASR